jgi:molecular chaperone DnaK
MIQDAQKYADVDRERKERVEKRTRSEALIFQAERQLREVALEFGMQFARSRRQRIDNICRDLKESLKENSDRGIDQAYADLQDALYELNREVRQTYAEDEDDDLLGTIRDIFTGGDKDKEREFPRDTYRERDSFGKDYGRDYGKDYGRDNSRDYGRDNNSRDSRSSSYESRPPRKSRPSYQDNWDDEDDNDWL